MKTVRWDPKKNEWLWAKRGIGFEIALLKIATGDLLDAIEHPKARYSHQRIYVMEIGNYVYLVPFVENENEVFLKTMIPSRQATKHYLGGAESQ